MPKPIRTLPSVFIYMYYKLVKNKWWIILIYALINKIHLHNLIGKYNKLFFSNHLIIITLMKSWLFKVWVALKSINYILQEDDKWWMYLSGTRLVQSDF